jgi:hypothetical protein
MASFSNQIPCVEFVDDGSYFAYKITYKQLIMRFIFPELTIIDNSDTIEDISMDSLFNKIIDPIYMGNLPITSMMSPKQKACMLLCGIYFYIFVQDKYNRDVEITDNIDVALLIFFFFIDASLFYQDYGHIVWGFCTYNKLIRDYHGDKDIFEIASKVSSKLIFYQNNMKHTMDQLSLNLSMRKIRMLEIHTKASLITVDTRGGDQFSPDTIDSFLYGITTFLVNETPVDYALFGGPLSILKDIDEYITTHPLTPYENAFFLNIFRIFSNACQHYSTGIMENVRRFRDICDSVSGEYMNGIIMCCLELYYFKKLTNKLNHGDIYEIAEEMCATKNICIKLSLSDWEGVYKRSLSKYMEHNRDNHTMTIRPNTDKVAYDDDVFGKIKSHIISYLNIVLDDSVSKQEVESCKNELKLIVLFLVNSDRSHNIKIIFISLIVFFIQVYAQRINNAYIHCMTIYSTTEKWFKKIYQILGYNDADFIDTVTCLRNEKTPHDISTYTDVAITSKTHFAFENAIYVYIYLKQMMEIFLRTVGMSISEIHRFKVIDFSGIKGHGGMIDAHIRSCVSKTRMHFKLRQYEEYYTPRYTNMTFQKLITGNINDYACRYKKTSDNLMDVLFTIPRDNQRYKRAISRHGVV